jgi:hypothetical protein
MKIHVLVMRRSWELWIFTSQSWQMWTFMRHSWALVTFHMWFTGFLWHVWKLMRCSLQQRIFITHSCIAKKFNGELMANFHQAIIRLCKLVWLITYSSWQHSPPHVLFIKLDENVLGSSCCCMSLNVPEKVVQDANGLSQPSCQGWPGCKCLQGPKSCLISDKWEPILKDHPRMQAIDSQAWMGAQEFKWQQASMVASNEFKSQPSPKGGLVIHLRAKP